MSDFIQTSWVVQLSETLFWDADQSNVDASFLRDYLGGPDAL
ncbi:MAG: hypothetical protein WCG80_04325 [Spirochaetales bacterium]